jgi:hypothetical protein
MVSSALANGQSLTLKIVSTLGIIFFASAMTSPAFANTAATASDNFRISPEDLKANQTALGVSDPEFRALADKPCRNHEIFQRLWISQRAYTRCQPQS